ncbi:glutathione S-transferase family protein [Phanerochaete sordida]|uniref:Glutathione S-transferase family protein n=1 Tax=Phanerochaete sordida TaxID=48140 RepID=A0A9P3LDT6_9APHY|nr:glutathione S-transferase family protein [Phanerochaete sordida]
MATHADLPVLHIWPKTEQNLSLDPTCVAALLYLQLAIPNLFELDYTTNPDLSPSGQLPYLSHGLHQVAGFEPIVKYVGRLALDGKRDLDEELSPLEKAQNAARVAHIESSLGDLVAHEYYSLSANWTRQTRHTLAAVLPFPQRYYVPERIRQSWRPRLEAAELWDVVGIEEEEAQERQRFSFRLQKKRTKKAQDKVKFKETSQRKKVTDKAKAFLDIYSRMLGDRQFFYPVSSPTTLDVVFAAHIHLLDANQPDPLFSKLIEESYPSLFAHCNRVFASAFTDGFPCTATNNTGFSLRSIFPHIPAARPHQKLHSPVWDAQERKFRLMRWGFFGGVGVFVASYLYFSGLVGVYIQSMQIVQAAIDAAEKSAAEEEEEEEEDEEDAVEDAENVLIEEELEAEMDSEV